MEWPTGTAAIASLYVTDDFILTHNSTFGSQAPSPVFVPTEDGLDEIDCAKFPLAATLDLEPDARVLLETAPDRRPTLRERVQALTQHRIGSPLWESAPVEAGPDWQRIATKLNRYLGGGRWPAPPYSASHASTVAMCLSLAMEAVGDA